MIFRFALYGFLKNQRYFDPFFVLFFLQLHLSYTEIGLIIGLRELLLNVFEIPSGALADVYGRRRCMCVSFMAYIVAFIGLALAQDFWHCLVAMLPLAIGDAFRTGTHKAMIFSWLREQDRLQERQGIYGYTRSWSKIGSAVSIPIACAIVLYAQDYRILFWASLLPYLFGLINVALYPRALDAERDGDVSIRKVMRQSFKVLRQCILFKPLRRLLCESMAFEGVFKANKDYIQVMVLALALSVPAFLGSEETQRTALLMGGVYVIVHALSAVASRYSQRFTTWVGNEHRAARRIWYINGLTYGVMTLALYAEMYALAASLFVAINVMQNIWRPLIITRFDSAGSDDDGATLLSVESQARSFACMLLAPLIGVAMDLVSSYEIGGAHWPLAAVGVLGSLWILLWFRE